MKRKNNTREIVNAFTLAIALLFFLNFDGIAQKRSNASDNDGWERAAIAFNKTVNDYYFTTPYGKACATILIRAHVAAFAYPSIVTNDISGADGETVTKLLAELKQLRNAPPTWEAILKVEESKLAVEFAPPSAPVFAGDVDRVRQSNQTLSRASDRNAVMRAVDLKQKEDGPEDENAKIAPPNENDDEVEPGKAEKK